MIPSIEQIIEDLMAGSITKSQAITWLLQHAQDAHQDLRDYFAGQVVMGLSIKREGKTDEHDAINAYRLADAMMKARGE